MTTVCASVSFDRPTTAAEVWDEMVHGHSALREINSCELINPMTGDAITIPSPPNRLAEILVDGQRVGVLRLPKAGTEMEVHFADEDHFRIEPILATIAANVGGSLQI